MTVVMVMEAVSCLLLFTKLPFNLEYFYLATQNVLLITVLDQQRSNYCIFMPRECLFCCSIIIDVDLQPVGRSWHSFTPLTSRQLFLYGGYTNDRRPLGEFVVLVPWDFSSSS